MFSFGGNDSTPVVNSRVRRAQQLRQQRLKAKGAGGGSATSGSRGGGSADDGGGELSVSGTGALLGALMIVALGASLAALLFSFYHPDCVKDLPLLASVAVKETTPASTASKGGRGVRRLETDVDSSATTSKSSVQFSASGSTTASGKFPPQCTPEQFEILGKQLPAGGCELRKNRAYNTRTDCSFSAATSTCGSIPYWFHQHIVERDLAVEGEEFTAILVGCNNAYDAIDLLRLATRDVGSKSYDKEAWRDAFLLTENPDDEVEERTSECPIQTISVIPGSLPQKAHIYGIEAMPKTFLQLEKTKASLGYGDELDFSHVAMASDVGTVRVNMEDPIAAVAVGLITWDNACRNVPHIDDRCATVPVDRIDNWIMTKPKLADNPDAPIHYMSVTVEGNDYEVLKGSSRTLRRVQYLDFDHHWYGDWGTSNRSLKDLMFRLKEMGFVCYLPGDGGNMWRITDCWQEHYEMHFFANIACVNTNFSSAQPLSDRMEQMFQETLNKPLL